MKRCIFESRQIFFYVVFMKSDERVVFFIQFFCFFKILVDYTFNFQLSTFNSFYICFERQIHGITTYLNKEFIRFFVSLISLEESHLFALLVLEVVGVWVGVVEVFVVVVVGEGVCVVVVGAVVVLVLVTMFESVTVHVFAVSSNRGLESSQVFTASVAISHVVGTAPELRSSQPVVASAHVISTHVKTSTSHVEISPVNWAFPRTR